MSIEIKRSCSLSILTLHTWAGTQGWLWQWMQSNLERTEALNRSQPALLVTKLDLPGPLMKSTIQEIKEEILSQSKAYPEVRVTWQLHISNVSIPGKRPDM